MVAGLLLAACGSGDSGAAAAARSRRRITFTYAPANAKDNSYEALAKDYEAAHPGVTIKLNKINAEAVNYDPHDPDAGRQRPRRHGAHRRLRPGRDRRPVRQGRPAPAS